MAIEMLRSDNRSVRSGFGSAKRFGSTALCWLLQFLEGILQRSIRNQKLSILSLVELEIGRLSRLKLCKEIANWNCDLGKLHVDIFPYNNGLD